MDNPDEIVFHFTEYGERENIEIQINNDDFSEYVNEKTDNFFRIMYLIYLMKIRIVSEKLISLFTRIRTIKARVWNSFYKI